MVLNPKNRLSNKEDILKAMRRGRKIEKRGFSVYMLKTQNLVSRATAIVPKKVSKKAAVRNKIRRRISEVMRENLAKTDRSMDIVVRVRVAATEMTFEEIKNDLMKLF